MPAGDVELRIVRTPGGYVWGVVEVWHPPDGSVIEKTHVGGVGFKTPIEAFSAGLGSYERMLAERRT